MTQAEEAKIRAAKAPEYTTTHCGKHTAEWKPLKGDAIEVILNGVARPDLNTHEKLQAAMQ